VSEFTSYLRANADRIPNYGERRRAGEAISTAFTESAVNQVISKRMVKKQQMRWSPRGAHLLPQVRTRVLNDTLTGDYRRWYPGFTHTSDVDALDDQLVAAQLPRNVPLSLTPDVTGRRIGKRQSPRQSARPARKISRRAVPALARAMASAAADTGPLTAG